MTEEKKGFFKRLVSGLTKTRDNIASSFENIFTGFSKIDDDFYDELEETMIMADLGIETTTNIIEDLKVKVKEAKIKQPEDSYIVFRKALQVGEEQESFFVLPLDTKNHPLCTAPLRVTCGLVDQTPAHPREVFKAAIRWGAQSVIVAHNHPSGDPTEPVDTSAHSAT